MAQEIHLQASHLGWKYDLGFQSLLRLFHNQDKQDIDLN